VRLRKSIELETKPELDYLPLTRDSFLKAFYPQLVEAFGMGNPDEADTAVRIFLEEMPIYKVCAFSEGKFTEEMLAKMLTKAQ
jgi:hypothetical protein